MKRVYSNGLLFPLPNRSPQWWRDQGVYVTKTYHDRTLIYNHNIILSLVFTYDGQEYVRGYTPLLESQLQSFMEEGLSLLESLAMIARISNDQIIQISASGCQEDWTF